jgi:F-type H+-transporting ATPase subunit b
MMEILQTPTFWVAVAFTIMVLLSYKKIGRALVGALDDRSAKIKAELDHARRLREEAEMVLADYKKKQAEYMKEAEGMLTKAREDANALTSMAEKDLKAALDARMKQALEKIAQEEDKAIQDVRNHVVDIALAAARAIIIDHVSTLSQDELVKLAMIDIERKLH